MLQRKPKPPKQRQTMCPQGLRCWKGCSRMFWTAEQPGYGHGGSIQTARRNVSGKSICLALPFLRLWAAGFAQRRFLTQRHIHIPYFVFRSTSGQPDVPDKKRQWCGAMGVFRKRRECEAVFATGIPYQADNGNRNKREYQHNSKGEGLTAFPLFLFFVNLVCSA